MKEIQAKDLKPGLAIHKLFKDGKRLFLIIDVTRSYAGARIKVFFLNNGIGLHNLFEDDPRTVYWQVE